MASTINASTSGAGGLITTADSSGVLELQSGGTTIASIQSNGLVMASGKPLVGGLQTGTAVTASGTEIDFTGIPSWVKRITVMFDGLSTNGTSIPIIQIGNAGGIENTGYKSSGGYFVQGTTSVAAAQTTGFGIDAGHLAAVIISGTAQLIKLSSNTWVCSMTGALGGGTAAVFSAGGAKTLSDTLDRIRITTVNGIDTFDAGTINIIYEG